MQEISELEALQKKNDVLRTDFNSAMQLMDLIVDKMSYLPMGVDEIIGEDNYNLYKKLLRKSKKK